MDFHCAHMHTPMRFHSWVRIWAHISCVLVQHTINYTTLAQIVSVTELLITLKNSRENVLAIYMLNNFHICSIIVGFFPIQEIDGIRSVKILSHPGEVIWKLSHVNFLGFNIMRKKPSCHDSTFRYDIALSSTITITSCFYNLF